MAASGYSSPWTAHDGGPAQQSRHRRPSQDRPAAPGSETKHYGPRTCRICLEVVQPTFEPPIEGIFRTTPSVTYQSDDGGGRLFRPCLCKGSQKYVHEGCLNAWRLHNPTNDKAFWQCPTCRYQYKLQRMTWARWIGSTTAQIILTVAIFCLAIFLLGYVADPIINLYVDPVGTITTKNWPSHDDDPVTWPEHFVKGVAGLGLVGFAKYLLTLSPWHWLNARNTGVLGGARAGATGRDRMQQISWIAVTVGVVAFLVTVWKGVRVWSRNTLDSVSEKVMDVPIADDDDDET